jgi:uncharacterized SAM-binding protein YcdF (DUF218 family)
MVAIGVERCVPGRQIIRADDRLLSQRQEGGALWVAVTVMPFNRWYAEKLAGPWRQPSRGVLVVLAADSLGGGMIGLASYWRATYALWVWRDGRFDRLVVSGGHGVGAEMKAFLESSGVPAGKITLEEASSSTRENAVFTASLLKDVPGEKALVTSDMHMFRSVRAFRKAGLEVTPVVFPYAIKRSNNWLDRWPVFLELCQETGKIAYYRVRGWI